MGKSLFFGIAERDVEQRGRERRPGRRFDVRRDAERAFGPHKRHVTRVFSRGLGGAVTVGTVKRSDDEGSRDQVVKQCKTAILFASLC